MNYEGEKLLGRAATEKPLRRLASIAEVEGPLKLW